MGNQQKIIENMNDETQLDLFDTAWQCPSSGSYTLSPASAVYSASGSSDTWALSAHSGFNVPRACLTIQDDATVGGKLSVGGVDIGDTLIKIEQRLNILRPNESLETRWDELKELGDRYRALEADILSKEELIKILVS